MPCANCREDFVTSVNNEDEEVGVKFIINASSADGIETGNECVVSVSSALTTIFEGSMKLNKKGISMESKIKLCPMCLQILSQLYNLFKEFMQTTKDGSYIQRLIESSCLWNFGHSTTRSQNGDEHSDYSQFVQVKLEVEEDDIADPLSLDVKEENSDPDYEPNPSELKTDLTDDEGFPFLRRTRRTTAEELVKRLRKSRERDGQLLKRKSGVLSTLKRKRTTSSKKLATFAAKRRKEVEKAESTDRTKPETTEESLDVGNTENCTPKKQFNCTEEGCTKSYADPKLLRRHIKYRHGGATPEEIAERTCTQCPKPKLFTTPGQLKAHISSVHATEFPFPCAKCDRKFPNKNRLQIHIHLKHLSTKFAPPPKEPYRCPHDCTTETFTSKVGLKLHLKVVHNEVKKYVCSECGIKCERPNQLKNHMKYRHGEGLTQADLEGHHCQTCSKTFDKPYQLKYHMKAVHATEKPFVCDYAECGRRFPTKNYLNIHLHMNHRMSASRFQCDQCGKVLSTKHSLQDHIQGVHLRTRTCVCEICGKKFRTPRELKTHSETHDSNRQRTWECTVCHQLFISERTLKNHIKTHSMEKDKLCTLCGDTFLVSASLKRHLHAVHGVTPDTGCNSKGAHSCDQCGKTFKLREYLLQHLRSKTHGGKGHTGQRKKEEAGESFTGSDSQGVPGNLSRLARKRKVPEVIARAPIAQIERPTQNPLDFTGFIRNSSNTIQLWPYHH